jgi:hypothetical protein
MNQTMTVVVALIAAAGLSTIVCVVPEQRGSAWLGDFGGCDVGCGCGFGCVGPSFDGCGFGFGGCQPESQSLLPCSPGQGIQYGHVVVVIYVKGDQNGRTGGASPSSFTENVFGNNPTPNTLVGGLGQSATLCGQFTTCDLPGTNVTLGFGSYKVTQAQNSITAPPNAQYSVTYNADCTGAMHSGETKKCTITDQFIQ